MPGFMNAVALQSRNARAPRAGRARRARWLHAWLVLALLVAPLLGHVHRVLHTDASHAVSLVQAGGAAGPATHGHPALADLFGSHAGSGDCRLYDQLGHGDLGCGVAALSLPAVTPIGALLVLREAAAVARRAALFEARGPPFFR